MFISTAYAQAATTAAPAAGSQSSELIMSVAPFAFIFAILYFLMIRPQQRRVKLHQEMIRNVRKGDVIVTSGGLIGKVDKIVDDAEMIVDLGDGNKVRMVRSMITEVRSKTEPLKPANDESKSSAKKSA